MDDLNIWKHTFHSEYRSHPSTHAEFWRRVIRILTVWILTQYQIDDSLKTQPAVATTVLFTSRNFSRRRNKELPVNQEGDARISLYTPGGKSRRGSSSRCWLYWKRGVGEQLTTANLLFECQTKVLQIFDWISKVISSHDRGELFVLFSSENVNHTLPGMFIDILRCNSLLKYILKSITNLYYVNVFNIGIKRFMYQLFKRMLTKLILKDNFWRRNLLNIWLILAT